MIEERRWLKEGEGEARLREGGKEEGEVSFSSFRRIQRLVYTTQLLRESHPFSAHEGATLRELNVA